jgi:hypothetical protein
MTAAQAGRGETSQAAMPQLRTQAAHRGARGGRRRQRLTQLVVTAGAGSARGQGGQLHQAHKEPAPTFGQASGRTTRAEQGRAQAHCTDGGAQTGGAAGEVPDGIAALHDGLRRHLRE